MASPASTTLAEPKAADLPQEVNPALEPLFNRIAQLAALPAVAREVLSVAQDPGSGVADLQPCVEKDPGLTAQIVRVSNSSFYAPREPIGNLQSALAMLGMDRARNLAMTVIVGQRFTAPAPLCELDHQRLWDHSVCVAAASRMLSRSVGFGDPEEAYLAGLVHDFGLVVLDQHLAEQVPRIQVLFRTGVDWQQAEQEVLGFDHAQLGGYIARRSGFPDRVIEAIDLHHTPEQATSDESAYLLSIVAIANYFITRMGRGAVQHRRLEPPHESVFDRLGLDRPRLREVWAEVEEQLAHVGGLM